MMKSLIPALALSFALTGSVYADCNRGDGYDTIVEPEIFQGDDRIWNIVDTNNIIINTKKFGKDEDPCSFFKCTKDKPPKFTGYMENGIPHNCDPDPTVGGAGCCYKVEDPKVWE